MPLIKSASKKAVPKNILREMAAGKEKKQAVAIALNVQRDRKSTRLNSSHIQKSRMPSSA